MATDLVQVKLTKIGKEEWGVVLKQIRIQSINNSLTKLYLYGDFFLPIVDPYVLSLTLCEFFYRYMMDCACFPRDIRWRRCWYS